MKKPYFSICLPVYNGERFIKRSVDSVISQSFKDWELIIYNNGSNDKTANILGAFQGNDKIKIINEEIQQSSAIPAWHKVMTMAKGEFILMLGFDDWFGKEFLSDSNHIINKHNLDILSGSTLCFNPEEILTDMVTSSSFIHAIPKKENKEGIYIFNGDDFIKGFLVDFEKGFSKMHLSSTLIKRELYEKVGGFNLNLKYCAEAELYLKLANHNPRFGFNINNLTVNTTGEGEYRRAFYLPFANRYHDFYKIVQIMSQEGMINSDQYNNCISKINRDAVNQGIGYSMFDAINNIVTYTPRKKFYWLLLLINIGFWVRIRQIIDGIIRRVFFR